MNPFEFLQENVFYTPEKTQEINNALRRTQMLAPNTPAAPALPGATGNVVTDNIFYSPERKQAINQALTDSQSKNPAMSRPVPGTAVVQGVVDAFASKPIPANPTLKYTPSATDSALRGIENQIGKYVPDFLKDLGTAAEKKGMGGLIPGVEMLLPDQEPIIKKPRFADLRGSATPGSMTPATDNSAADKAFADAAKFQAGTDTGSGDREVTRVAQTDNMSDNMKIWAAANPELAANLVKKVDERRMNSPEYTQVGYDQAKKQVDPSYDPSVRSQNFGPVANGEVYGRNLDLQGTTGVGPVEDGALYADMISGKEKPNADKASDLLNNYKAQLSANLEPFAETVIPSQSQNPVTFGGDNTPIDSELELSKVIPDFTGKMAGLNKNMSNRFRAF